MLKTFEDRGYRMYQVPAHRLFSSRLFQKNLASDGSLDELYLNFYQYTQAKTVQFTAEFQIPLPDCEMSITLFSFHSKDLEEMISAAEIIAEQTAFWWHKAGI